MKLEETKQWRQRNGRSNKMRQNLTMKILVIAVGTLRNPYILTFNP